MAASGARFESAKDIHDKRESKRMAREKELQRAKDAFEKQEKLKEQKRLRGEDTWMLTDVNERLDQLAQEHSGKKKKKKEKHSKKAKKEKKQKSKKQKLEKSDECTDSSSESENEWVESTPVSKSGGTQKAWQIKTDQSDTEATAAVQRDEWMTLDFMSMKTTSVACIRAEKQKEKEAELEKAQAIEQANALSRELNPYWKDGGMGLPPEEGDTTSVKKDNVNLQRSILPLLHPGHIRTPVLRLSECSPCGAPDHMIKLKWAIDEQGTILKRRKMLYQYFQPPRCRAVF